MEVNSTFYEQPRADVTAGWAARTPARFEFSLKLYQKFTHPEMFRGAALKSAPGSGGSLLVKKVRLYTNNHFAAKSVVNAVMLKAQLGEPIEGEYPRALVERYPEIRDLVATPRTGLRASP